MTNAEFEIIIINIKFLRNSCFLCNKHSTNLKSKNLFSLFEIIIRTRTHAHKCTHYG